MIEDLLDVEQGFYVPFHLGHAEDVFKRQVGTEIGCVFDVCSRDGEHLFDSVDDETGQGAGAGCGAYLNDDNAGTLRGFGFSQTEAKAEVEDGNDFTPEINDPFDVLRHSGNGGDIEETDNLANFEHLDAVGFAAEREGEVFAGRGRGG